MRSCSKTLQLFLQRLPKIRMKRVRSQRTNLLQKILKRSKILQETTINRTSRDLTITISKEIITSRAEVVRETKRLVQ